MKYYVPKHFSPEELVPPEVFSNLGESSLLVMDYRILKTADTIRDYFGKKVTINNWKFGGERVNSGFRFQNSEVGAKWSQHKFGRAIDCLIEDIPPETARRAILQDPAAFEYVRCIEDNVSWLHVDCRAVEGIVII